MEKSVVIDYLPESALRYGSGWAVVAVDVIRATTTAVTAAAGGWRCFIAHNVQAALALAPTLDNPLLAGETGGQIPLLVSSSGTRLIYLAAGCEAIYLACFRNYSAVVEYVAGRHSHVAIIGAGSRNEFREEDQICCAWIGAGLIGKGYASQDENTREVIRRWQNATPKACLCSHSVDYLLRTGQLKDLDFILSHVNDLQDVFTVRDAQVMTVPREDLVSAVPLGNLGELPAVAAAES